jgi:hypothetical protein
MSRKKSRKARKNSRGGALRVKGMPGGTVTFKGGAFTGFTPAAQPQDDDTPDTADTAAEGVPAEQPQAAEAELLALPPADAASTRVHGIPGVDGPTEMVFTGEKALPGFDLSFAELAELAGMAGVADPDGDPLEGEVLAREVAEKRQRLADAEEAGEGPLELAHAVAYLDSVHKAIGARLRVTRQRAEEVFALCAQLHGTKSVGVELDDGGGAVCAVHIKDCPDEVRWQMDAVKAYCRRWAPTELEDRVLEGALRLPDVRAYIAQFHPDYVRQEVRPAFLTRLRSEIDDQGVKADPNGEPHKLGTVVRSAPTGQFVLRYARPSGQRPEGKQRIRDAFRSGLLGDVLAIGVDPDRVPDSRGSGDGEGEGGGLGGG